jgi:CheY-like chemotaxis protein
LHEYSGILKWRDANGVDAKFIHEVLLCKAFSNMTNMSVCQALDFRITSRAVQPVFTGILQVVFRPTNQNCFMNKKIAVIEDDDDLRNLIVLSLKSAGFVVEGMPNGDQLQLVETDTDLYIIDINLGAVSGLDLCKKIKNEIAARKQTPVIVIIASANADLKALASGVCADDTLAKPFNSSDLIKKVSQYLAAPASPGR